MGNTLSDAQQTVVAGIVAMQLAATRDPYLNGSDTAGRLRPDG